MGLFRVFEKLLQKVQLNSSSDKVASYILEYRYTGYPDKYYRNIYNYFQRKFKMCHPLYHYVPHITILGPITCSNENKLIKLIKPVVSKYHEKIFQPGNLVQSSDLMKFRTPIGTVLAVQITQTKLLEGINKDIQQAINYEGDISCKYYPERIWHTTIWNNKSGHNCRKFGYVWNNVQNYKAKKLDFIIDRICLIKNGKIVVEFDLVNNEVLDREEALNSARRYESYLRVREALREAGETVYQRNKSFRYDSLSNHVSPEPINPEFEEQYAADWYDGTFEAERNWICR